MKPRVDSSHPWRMRVAVAVPAVLLLTMVGRLVHIQRVVASDFESRLRSQHQARMEIPCRRGLILDSHGRVLAGSKPVQSLYADPSVLLENPEDIAKLARALPNSVSAYELERKLRSSSSPKHMWLARSMRDDQAQTVLDLKIPGVFVEHESRRVYPLDTTLAHVLGFVGADQTGLEGLELKFDKHLSGVPGQRSAFVTASRRAISEGDEPLIPPQDGGHLVLTIDSVIQEIAERTLKVGVEHVRAEAGVAIVMDPSNGDVLAMASFPTFNPAEYSKAAPATRRNLAVTDPLEPGSTMKPFIASAAVASGKIKLTDSFDCGMGQCAFGSRIIHDAHPSGVLTVPEIVIKSSNIGMAKIGQRVGNGLLYDTVRKFGFGTPTGIELPGEDNGIVLPFLKWTSFSTNSVPFGQEISVTPIQLATAFAGLVNDGVLLKPHIVKALLAADGSVIEAHNEPEVVRTVIPANVSRYFCQEVLTRVVSDNASNGARIEGYRVLGKTGTAQVARHKSKGYEENAYTSSFVGAAPASDPRLVVLVMIRRPDKAIAHFGATVAAPVAGAIFREALPYLDVPFEVSPKEDSQRDLRMAQAHLHE